jgi:hypothetical protein
MGEERKKEVALKGITGCVPTLIARNDALGVRTVLNNYNATG